MPQPPRKVNSEQAKEMAMKSHEIRKRNSKDAKTAAMLVKKILFSKTEVNSTASTVLKSMGLHQKKREEFFTIAVASLLGTTIKKGNVNGFVELVKLAGCHPSQSPDALGGENNPVSVRHSIAMGCIKSINEELERLC